MEQKDGVGVLLDLAGLAQVFEVWHLVGFAAVASAQLRERYYWDLCLSTFDSKSAAICLPNDMDEHSFRKH